MHLATMPCYPLFQEAPREYLWVDWQYHRLSRARRRALVRSNIYIIHEISVLE